MFHGFQPHLVGESPLAGENGFPLQIGTTMAITAASSVHISHNHRNGFQPCQLCGVQPPMAGDDLIAALWPGAGNGWSKHPIPGHAFHRPLHGLVIHYLEGVILKGVKFGQREILNLFQIVLTAGSSVEKISS